MNSSLISGEMITHVIFFIVRSSNYFFFEVYLVITSQLWLNIVSLDVVLRTLDWSSSESTRRIISCFVNVQSLFRVVSRSLISSVTVTLLLCECQKRNDVPVTSFSISLNEKRSLFPLLFWLSLGRSFVWRVLRIPLFMLRTINDSSLCAITSTIRPSLHHSALWGQKNTSTRWSKEDIAW